MTAEECIKGRRSIRKFTAEPVSHELLARIVETASFAPSWKIRRLPAILQWKAQKRMLLPNVPLFSPEMVSLLKMHLW